MKRLLSILLIAVLLSSTVVSPLHADAGDIITLAVGNTEAFAGQNQVDVDIHIQGNSGLSGFSFCVNHDEDLIFKGAEILINGGYHVVRELSGRDANLAWTGDNSYTGNGKLATVHFEVVSDARAGNAEVSILFRDGYDSVYTVAGGTEVDRPVQTSSGNVTIIEPETSDLLCVAVGTASASQSAVDVVIPIRLTNNTEGISGFSFCINFDSARIKLESAEVALSGYKVVSHPSGYGVNLAWTSDTNFTADGDIAYLHFSVPDESLVGRTPVSIVFRPGYDSFYKTINREEQDLPCESKNGYIDITLADHHFGEWVIIKEPTCTEKGLKRRTCTDPGCGKVEEQEIPMIPHDYQVVVTSPTCTAQGYTTHTCSMCGDSYVDSYTDIIPHTESEWLQSVAPGCVTQGEEIQKCTVCGALLNTRVVPALGHNFGEWETYREPTFSTDGESRRYCSRCDAYESQRIPKLSESHTHDFSGREEVIKEPTCTEEGSKRIYCTEPECGEYTVVPIPALGHDLIHHEAKAATCTDPGWEAYDNCSRCDYSTYVSIPALGHTPSDAVKENITEATCTEGGRYDSVVYCSRCQAELNRTTTTVPALGHNYGAWTETKAPTCTEAGEETRICDRCSASEKRSVTALGHDLIHHDAKAPTCTEPGWDAYDTCSRCAYSTYTARAALGHDFGEWQTYREPTFSEDGENRRYCSRCDAYESQRVPKLSESHTHDFSGREETVKTPTCTEEGSKRVYCTNPDCGEYTVVPIPALGHDLVHHDGQAATCTASGWEAYDTCSRCDYSTYVAIPAAGHSAAAAVRENVTEATCTEGGRYDSVVYCAVCHAELSRSVVYTEALGHDFGTWTQTKAPTCVENGEEKRYCSRCEAFEQRFVAALGHALTHHEAKAPTCTEIGWEAYDTCSRCDYTTYAERAALGHAWEFAGFTWTNVSGGYTAVARYSCTRDASHADQREAVVTKEVTLEPSAGNDGIMTYTATISAEESLDGIAHSESREEVIPAEGYHITLTDYTKGKAEATLDLTAMYSGEVSFAVSCEMACVVAAVTADGYKELACVMEDNVPLFTLQVEADVELVIVLRGDTNLDGSVGTKDATFVRKIVAQVAGIETQLPDLELSKLAGDANADGSIGTKDATAIRKVVAQVAGFILPWKEQ